MTELLRACRLLGWRHLWRLQRARRWGWEGVISGYCLTRAIQTVLDIGLVDAMQRQAWIDARGFATERGLAPDVLAALCEYLYARKVLRKKDTRFGLGRKGRLLADTDVLRGWFTLVHGYEPVLHRLDRLAAGTERYGSGIARDPERVAVGSGLASAGFYFPIVVDLVRAKGWRTVLDVGCGDGAFLRLLCRELPHVRGIGVDLAAAAVARGRARLTADGWNDRIALHQGDALEVDRLGESPEAVEAATAFFVLHELANRDGDGDLLAFMRRFRAAYPRAALVVVETLRPDAAEMRRRPGPAIEYFLLHDLSLQTPLGREAWKRVLWSAGFTSVEERFLSFARSAVYVAS